MIRGHTDRNVAFYRRGLTTIAVAIGLLLYGQSRGSAQGLSPTEYQIKAAFLFNFAKFVEWPPKLLVRQDAPITIGVLGEDPFGEDLDKTIAGKSVNGRVISIKRFRSFPELEVCHILFVSPSLKRDLAHILEKTVNSGTLTVSEMDQFSSLGGMITLVLGEDNKVRFDINVEVAEREGLKISSKLIKLARTVNEAKRN